MHGYIYKTTNLINGKIYIGQHVSQKFEPTRYIGSGAIFTKAIQLRWFGSIFAWILNTNPVKLFSSGLIFRSSASIGRGEGAISTKQSNNSLTPNVLSAEPKNTGATLPFKYSSLLNSG